MSSGSAKHRGVPGTLRIFQAFGINVYLHWSWALVAIIELQVRHSSYSSQMWNLAEYVSLFGIVLLHEFGHALACLSVGGRVDRILLWPLGGIAYVRPPRRPGAFLWSLAAGPLVNVVLIPVTFGLMIAFGGPNADSPSDFQTYLKMITLINLVLLIFNMLPIYPLDGGQILQSILWFFIGPHRSLTVAATVGLVGAGGVVVLAMYWADAWLIILALFGASRSWQGLKTAKAMAGLLAFPRHVGTQCPACREAAPLGPFWRCHCGQPFDTFATAGCCPQCGARHETTGCPLCGESNPHVTWLTLAGGTLPQPGSRLT